MITIVDVAAEAGVSTATVSRVVSGGGVVSAATRRRVLATVARLRYEPNAAARSLRILHGGEPRLAAAPAGAERDRPTCPERRREADPCSPVNNRAALQLLQQAIGTRQASKEQVFDVRGSIEVRAAEIAALTRSDDDARALRHEVAAMKKAGQARERFVNADVRFHEIISRATGNPLFVLLGSALRDSLDCSIRAGFDSRGSKTALHRIVEIHEGIAAAVLARKPADAGRWMSVHFHEAREYVLNWDAAAQAPPVEPAQR